MKTSNWATKILLSTIIVGTIFSPFASLPAYAAAGGAGSGGGSSESSSTTGGSGTSNSGAGGTSGGTRTTTGGGTTTTGGNTTGVANLAGEALTCSVGTLIASVLTSAITTVLGAALSNLAIPGLKVKVQDPTNEVKTYGLTIAGLYIPIFPSLDAIAYCLVNALITYIADATIVWIRGGFEGNPVFVDDPGQFFQGLVDYEISNFIGGLGNGVLCQGVDIELQVALLQEATRSTGRQSSCSAESAMQRIQSGNFVTADYSLAYQDPKQLPINAYFSSTNQLNTRINANLGVAQIELEWNKGFLSFKDPENPSRTITPGQLIEKQLSERLGLSEKRLVLAEKFDQVITELVNALVKIALNEVFEAVGSGERNYGAYENYYDGISGSGERPFLAQ
jgi:hypothetical protein